MKPEERLWIPNSTQVPDVILDYWMATVGDAEFKVLMYITRRTYGFRKSKDAISLSQIENGIVKKSGEVLDLGTGKSRSTVVSCLKSLEKRGLIKVIRTTSDKEKQVNQYILNLPDVVQISYYHPDNSSSQNKLGVGQEVNIQDTVIQNTEKVPPPAAQAPTPLQDTDPTPEPPPPLSIESPVQPLPPGKRATPSEPDNATTNGKGKKVTDPTMPNDELTVWQNALYYGKTGIDYVTEKDNRPPQFWATQFTSQLKQRAKWWAGYLPSASEQPPPGVTPELLVEFYTWCRVDMDLTPATVPWAYEAIERQWANFMLEAHAEREEDEGERDTSIMQALRNKG
jgi:hypothetical protein